jgi:hypothetical protein
MPRLEELTRGALVKGIRPDGLVTVLDVRWYGVGAVELTFKDGGGAPGNEILYRGDEARLEIVAAGPAWTFAADGHLFKLASEAYRIRLAHLFDPLLAVHTSQVVPLPHQILAEGQLHADVTRYVRDEFNRADKLDERRRGTVGFALTILQRRLASSSEAICQSLRRRRERLDRRLEAERGERSPEPGAVLRLGAAIELSPDELDDLDDVPETEVEAVEEQILDQATAARTLAELAAEIATLQGLERQALKVRHGGTDRKWDELRSPSPHVESFNS